MLDSTFSAAESRAAGYSVQIPGAAATTCARSVYLPPLTKFRREPDEGDSEGENESGWELSERTKRNSKSDDEKVVKGVEVVVKREVETWDSDGRV